MTSICIDGFNLSIAKGSGIATYGRNLLEAVQTLGLGSQILYGPDAHWGGVNVLNEAHLVEAKAPAQKLNFRRRVERLQGTFFSQFGRSVYPVVPSGEVIWPGGSPPLANGFWAARELFGRANRCFARYGNFTPVSFRSQGAVDAPEVMHWTSNLPLFAKDRPNIYTFHDLIPLRLPHTVLGSKARYMAMSQEMAARADHIVVVSEATRQDVIRLLRVDEDRVTTTYQAVQMPEHIVRRSQHDVMLELEGVFGLDWKGYFLHFGAVEPKKNLGRIVEAYLASGVQSPLVLVGGRAWLEKKELTLINQVKRDQGPGADRIRQYDYMSESMLISLIRGAKGVLFPSLYEGFGLPVLEAMTLSTAVLTSTAGALPEVAGEAAFMVDAYDVQAITRGIRAIDADPALRADLEMRGPIQAAKFSPQAYRDRLVRAYSSVGVTLQAP